MKRTQKAAVIAAVCYALLTCFMFAVAYYSKSRGVLIGGVITSVRLVTAITLVFGLRLSERRTENFPMGLYKLQNLIAALIGVFVIIVAYEYAKMPINNSISVSQPVKGAALALASLPICAVVAGFFAWYKSRVGKAEFSPGLTADAKHSLGDFIAISIIILGIGLAMAGVPHMITVAEIIAGIYLFLMGAKITIDALKVLLDASVERDVLENVRRIALANPMVKSVVDVKGRNSGSYRFINITVLVTTTDLREASEISSELERVIHAQIPRVDQVMVEFGLEQEGRLSCAVPACEDGETVAYSFEDAPCFELLEIDVKGKMIASRERLNNPVDPGLEGRGVRLAVSLSKRGLDALLIKESLDDDDIAVTLDAYDVALLLRPGVGTLADAEKELLSRFIPDKGGAV